MYQYQSLVLRVGLTTRSVGFIPSGWRAHWCGARRWRRLIDDELLMPYQDMPTWQQASYRAALIYPVTGVYRPGRMLHAWAETPPFLWDRGRFSGLNHQLRLLWVLDRLSDAELYTWVSEAQLIAHFKARGVGAFRVPDGLYRTAAGDWVAVEVWSEPTLGKAELREKAETLWRHTHVQRLQIVFTATGETVAWVRPREAEAAGVVTHG